MFGFDFQGENNSFSSKITLITELLTIFVFDLSAYTSMFILNGLIQMCLDSKRLLAKILENNHNLILTTMITIIAIEIKPLKRQLFLGHTVKLYCFFSTG